MKDGYIRVASASIDTLIGNVKHNANEIKKVLKETREKKAQVVVFPELVLSGYTLEDLFLQNRLLNECLVQLEEIMHDTKGHQQIVVIGLPFHYQNNLYNEKDTNKLSLLVYLFIIKIIYIMYLLFYMMEIF